MIKRLMTMALLVLCLLAAAAAGAEEMTDAAETASSAAQKVVYLTFDDGPKADTPELLALLEELDVPATFFFVGLAVRAYPEHAKMVVDAGHAVGCHTMGHSPGMIKKDVTFIARDIERFLKEMRGIAGEDFTTDLYRFPGGSTSYSSRAKHAVVDAGFSWFDWNAMTGDTHAGVTQQDLYDLAVETSADEEVVILLMHEAKVRTRRILPDLVAYYREHGYEFRRMSTDPVDRALYARCPAHMMLTETEQENETEEETP